MPPVKGRADFSRDRRHRYRLERRWEDARPTLGVIMLNPSAADAHTDDPTIRRVTGFARAWGFGGLDIVNLFSLRTPSPSDLCGAPDPLRRAPNDRRLRAVIDHADALWLAWGAHGVHMRRADEIARLLLSRKAARPTFTIGLTKNAQPRHPLYAPRHAQRFVYEPCAGDGVWGSNRRAASAAAPC